MGLDLSQVALQVQAFVGQLRDAEARQQDRQRKALDELRRQDEQWGALRAVLEDLPRDRLLWRPPRLRDGLIGGIPAAPCLPEYTVLAVDGSHIEPDRHRSVACYLINLGQVALHYGLHASAALTSQAALCPIERIAEETDAPSDGEAQEEFDRAHLTAQRTLQELETLAALAAKETADPTLALFDGSLFWNLGRYPWSAGEPRDRKERLLQRYAVQLRRFRELARGRRLVLAGYISFPGGHEIGDALRIAVCPSDRREAGMPHCFRYCRPDRVTPEQRPCSFVGEVLDRDLFAEVLEVGERSAVFLTGHERLDPFLDDADKVCFYYLKTAAEMVRVEVPRWVADDPELLGLSHSLALDQAQRGQGYPEALMEADALAALSFQDRERFWELVEQQLSWEGMAITGSAKHRSKRLRWI